MNVNELETPETEAGEQQAGTPSEQPQVTKSFSEMTDDERLALSDEDLAKYLEADDEEQESDGDAPAEDEPEGGDKDDPAFEKKTTEDKREEVESEFEKISRMSESEFNALPKEKKGVFFEMRSERNKRQELERELEKERAIRDGQLKVIENLKHVKGTQSDGGEQHSSEYEKVLAAISTKGEQYQMETGDEYRLTLKDQMALTAAQKADNEAIIRKQAEASARVHHERTMTAFQERIDAGIKQLKESGIEDFDHVYANYIEPVVNPDKSRDPDEARANAQILINLAMKGKNAVEYAYKHFARLTPEGQKYFREKEQRDINKKLVAESSKKTTTTSAHAEGSRSTTGKTAVDMVKLNSNFEYYSKILTDDQFTQVVSGKVVHI